MTDAKELKIKVSGDIVEDALKDAGREISEILLENAVRKSETNEQMLDQLAIAHHAAINILCQMIMNAKLQNGATIDFCIEEVIKEIKAELDAMENNSKFTREFVTTDSVAPSEATPSLTEDEIKNNPNIH